MLSDLQDLLEPLRRFSWTAFYWLTPHSDCFATQAIAAQLPGARVLASTTLGYELARDALKEWLRRGGKPAQLIQIASQLPRASGPVLRALEALT